MKKKVIIFIIFLIISKYLGASESNVGYFILPEGYPFCITDSKFVKDIRIRLKFGSEVNILKKIQATKLNYYYCSNGNYSFYLPKMYITKNPVNVFFDKNGNISIGSEVIDRINSIPLQYRPSDLVSVPEKNKAKGYKNNKLMLRKEANEAFSRMIDDAENDGIIIRILSAFRDSKYQSYLYLNAIKKRGIYQNSVAKPGHSEHQLGTACDLTTKEIKNSLSTDFEDTKAYRWLCSYAHCYGIYLSYPKYKKRITGYIYEPWHFRYWGKNRWEKYSNKIGIFFNR